jgi:hypothetical protein
MRAIAPAAALALHETRMICRRGVWPAALTLHALAASLFVSIWGPVGGVSLWDASVLQQLAALDRVISAVVLTWLATFVIADDPARTISDWSALTGRSAATVFRARVAALCALTCLFVAVAVPAFVAASDLSAASNLELARQLGAEGAFAVFCVGVTALSAVALDHRVAAWCSAMICCIAAAAGVHAFDTTLLRTVAPAAAGLMFLIVAPMAIRVRPSDAA